VRARASGVMGVLGYQRGGATCEARFADEAHNHGTGIKNVIRPTPLIEGVSA
jgi:hypothetical protein